MCWSTISLAQRERLNELWGYDTICKEGLSLRSQGHTRHLIGWQCSYIVDIPGRQAARTGLKTPETQHLTWVCRAAVLYTVP